MDKTLAAILRCEGHTIPSNPGKFFFIYPFTTENITGYINHFDLKNKSLLTVGSSSDQAINAILNDCTNITLIDINPFIKEYFYLKKVAIEELSYNEFLEFFCYIDYPVTFKENKKAFQKDIYLKLVKRLRLEDYESYLFWDELFQTYSGERIRRKLFSTDESKVRVLKEQTEYLSNEEKYLLLKSKIKNTYPQFIIGDITKLNLNDTYDNIFLSNIADYIGIEKTKELFNKLLSNLNINGKILISYLFDTKKDTPYQPQWHEVYNIEKFLKKLPEDIEFINFLGTGGILHSNSKIQDAIITYQKKR